MAATPDKSENFFMYLTDKELYLAIFNFEADEEMKGLMDLSRLNISAKDIASVEELWTGTPQIVDKGSLSYAVPAQDVRVYKFEKY